MNVMKFKPAISAAAVSLALSACAMIPKYEQPAVAVPEAFQHDTAQSGIVAASLGWQDYFADPRLHRLIEIALERNTDLRGAALNAEAVRAQYMISRAALLPGINASGTGQRGRVAADLSGSAGGSYVSSV
jgi:multidrug efflux system outer membrane protein